MARPLTRSPARPLAGLLVSSLLAVALLLVPAAASADTVAEDLVLAAEAEEGAETGPAPKARDAEGNDARTLAGYENPELQFTWGASFLLLGLVVTMLVVGGALWYLLVLRPTKQQATH